MLAKVVGEGEACIFRMFTVVKYGHKWDLLGLMTKIKRLTFEKMIFKFVKVIGPTFNSILVDEKRKESRKEG